jgi:thiol:disulfide interchange protein DsbD
VAANHSVRFGRFKTQITKFLLYRSMMWLLYSARMKILLTAFLLLLAGAASAKPWWMRGAASNEADFLPPDVAFRVAASVDDNIIRVRWVIADGYYLYRHRMNITAESPDLVTFAPAMPPGVVKVDPYFGSQEIYRQQVEAAVRFTRIDAGAHPLQIKVIYQGCADAGLCYPPITKVIYPQESRAPAASASHPFEATAILAGGLAFLLAGLLLRKGRKLELPAA